MTEPVMVGGGPAAASNKRALVMLGVAAVVAVMALVLPKLLFGGGDEAVDDFDEFAVVAPTDALAPAAGGAGPDEVVAEPVRTFEVFSTKNPFTPLVDATPVAAIAPAAVAPAPVAPAPVAVAPATAPVVGSIVAPVAVAPAPLASSGGAAPADVAPAPTTATEPGSGQRVALLEVFVDESGVSVASVRVNDTVYEVAEGTAFATRYQAVTLSVADGCGQFLYGDDRFRLCEGEELLK